MSLIIDMDRHFSEQLRRLINDTVDTCQRDDDIQSHEIIAMIVAGLWYELTIAAHLSVLSEKDFTLCAATAYRAMARKIKKERGGI